MSFPAAEAFIVTGLGFALVCIILECQKAKLRRELSRLRNDYTSLEKTWKFCLSHIEDLKKEPQQLQAKNEALSELLYQMRQTLRKMKGRGIAECRVFPSNDWINDAILKRTNRGLKKPS